MALQLAVCLVPVALLAPNASALEQAATAVVQDTAAVALHHAASSQQCDVHCQAQEAAVAGATFNAIFGAPAMLGVAWLAKRLSLTSATPAAGAAAVAEFERILAGMRAEYVKMQAIVKQAAAATQELEETAARLASSPDEHQE